jgi:replication-associated recombination protein RarA
VLHAHLWRCWRVLLLQVFVLAGPAGSGRSTLARQLLQDFKGKLAPVPLLTNRWARITLVLCTAQLQPFSNRRVLLPLKSGSARQK